MTPEQRTDRARRAVTVRWERSKPQRAARRFLRHLFLSYVKEYRLLPDELVALTRPLLKLDRELELRGFER